MKINASAPSFAPATRRDASFVKPCQLLARLTAQSCQHVRCAFINRRAVKMLAERHQRVALIARRALNLTRGEEERGPTYQSPRGAREEEEQREQECGNRRDARGLRKRPQVIKRAEQAEQRERKASAKRPNGYALPETPPEGQPRESGAHIHLPARNARPDSDGS